MADILVISLEQAVAAPLCSRKLADFGARVVKIERPEGDFAREYDRVVYGQSTYFLWLNRGKQSICLNLKEMNDRSLLDSMMSKADVFIHNLKPTALPSLTIDVETWRKNNPSLITCAISGYGDFGPYSKRKAYDLLVQAECGLAAITGSPAEPSRVGISVVDIAAGVTAYEAILEALLRRMKTGKGDHIEVSLFDAITEWMTVPLMHARYGSSPKRVGLRHPNIAPYGVFTCADGGDVLLAVQNEREWAALCQILMEQPDLATNGSFLNNTQRVVHRERVDTLVQNAIGALSLVEVSDCLDRADVAYGLINEPRSVLDHPQLRNVEIKSPGGAVVVPAPAARFRFHKHTMGSVPALNEHCDAIRREFTAATGAYREILEQPID